MKFLTEENSLIAITLSYHLIFCYILIFIISYFSVIFYKIVIIRPIIFNLNHLQFKWFTKALQINTWSIKWSFLAIEHVHRVFVRSAEFLTQKGERESNFLSTVSRDAKEGGFFFRNYTLCSRLFSSNLLSSKAGTFPAIYVHPEESIGNINI